MPAGVVENQNDGAISSGSGFLREGVEDLLEQGLGDSIGHIPVAEASKAVGAETAVCGSAPGSAGRGRMIEIETAGARVHVPEGADAKTLSIVLAALRRAS